MHCLSAAELAGQIRLALQDRGVPTASARDITDTLIEGSLMGIDTHGVELLPVYLRELDGGRANAEPRLHLTSGMAGTACLNANHALGPVAAAAAVREVSARARACGIAALAVADSNHLGAAGVHARAIAAQGQIGIVLSNTDALVAPVGGVVPLLGTNPIACAVQGRGDAGFFLDMATSAVSFTRISQCAREGALQPGWAIDGDGNDAVLGGAIAALLPFGGYKGQGLGMFVQILCSLLARMPFDRELQNMYVEPYDTPRRIAHFFIALDIAAFMDITEFQDRLQAWIEQYRRTPAAPGQRVCVPGDLEREARQQRLISGIPVSAAVLVALQPRSRITPFPRSTPVTAE
jgi:ureidoglycolate dehydrogenase (NAD+)